MSKAILRWTIGDVSDQGHVCFRMSFLKIFNLYGYDFDYFVCYNNIDLSRLSWLKNYSVRLLNQHDFVSDIKINPIQNNPCWKLYPPRIDLNRHEMWIDNDLIIYKKIPIIDKFLNSKNTIFITEGQKRSYGCFDNLIQSKEKLNTGFFGLFPGFDLKNEINTTLKNNSIENWKNHLDEQGLLSYIFLKNRLEIITLEDIYVCHIEFPYKVGKYGQHFVQLNQGKLKHWNVYINTIKL